MQHIRVSDGERERACAILREHYVVGRLNDQELSTRLAGAQTAVTWGDLNELMHDLPAIPGMPLAPVAYPPPPVAYAQPTQVTYAPAPPGYQPAMPLQDPGKGYMTAAWISFVLGFASFGVMWAPALAFALLARRARARGHRDPNTGWKIGLVAGAAVLAALVLLPAGFDDGDDSWERPDRSGEMFDPNGPGIHKGVLEIEADKQEATAEDVSLVTAESETTSPSMVLPIREPFDVDTLDDLSVTAKAPDGVRLTCRITVDGTVVKEDVSKPGGECEASYDD
ncbi:DUF1707 SHOCT-like domain-containing protein [Herbidospora mongoliensis]|uniref:DUF1707 SHOCT-like domain-containing protein n=1 Tax=Herbidospora mongoliensis TaxID=688067 RepID=UPI00082EEAD2|nr:DUF1707 domain-containing protein [Herbidospora mongoliensis]